MFVRNLLTLSKFKPLSTILVAIMINGINAEEAAALTANDVLNNMSSDESTSYINGVVEGLAYSRWLRDKPSVEGMNCINNWHYKGGDANYKRTLTWLERHPDKPVGALLHVLIKKECGV